MARLIPLIGKGGQGKFAIVDDEDYERLSKYKWYYTAVGGYASRYDGTRGYSTLKRMHREVFHAKSEEKIDHINGNGLDNRRSNLRACTHQQNLWNSKRKASNKSGYKGVTKSGTDYEVYIRINGKVAYVGVYSDLVEAAKSYDAVARFYFGEFARTNFQGDEALSLNEIKEKNPRRRKKSR